MQKSDNSLQRCWKEATSSVNSDFVIENDFLLRKATVNGFAVKQLVIPVAKREQIISLAHDSVWGSHFASNKTAKRILAHFYWPKLFSDVDRYCHSCAACQKRALKTKRDRVPITAVERPLQAFSVCEVDLIGPIDPKSSKGHAYILTFICLSTKWTEAVPLKSLRAEETCDALMKIFSFTGFPKVLITDNGTNFTSAGTTTMLQRLGIEIRHSTQGHPQGNGGIERWNAVLKRMLHHVLISDKPRNWHEKLPYLLFSYREIPHSTTGFPPYQLLFGNAARGPLAALHDSWTGTESTTTKMSKSSKEYLELLKQDLDMVQKIAADNTKTAQDTYVSYYNQHASQKTFNVGDEVLVLHPTSGNKLLTQWEGVGTVVAMISPNSYRVSLPSGARRTFHANDLRPFVARISMLGIIFEDQSETDFGQVETCPPELNSFQDNLSKIDLSHLSNDERGSLISLLRKYESVFNDSPGLCKVTEHEINTVPDFQPKHQRPYRIPYKLQQEVDRQINLMLAEGKIRPSCSPYAHPIVCVPKPNGDVRICADLRQVNSGTIEDRYPMARPDQLLLHMAHASHITTLDCAQGYYQIPMKPEHVHKTAFVTHNGSYEYLVMPFGAKNASMTFQRCMDTILRPKCSNFAHAYIDDTAVYSSSFSSHLLHLEEVLSAFKSAGMTLKLAKCNFALPRVKFIGHLVGSGQRLPLQDKLQAIRDIPEPKTKKALRSFLGLISFYREYVYGFAHYATPLTDLTKKNVKNKIQFTDCERVAFNTLKQLLCNATALQTPDYDKEFIIHTDASDYAVAACLSQFNSDNSALRPIAFASKKLSDTQRRWSASERECFATIFALQSWDVIIYGCKIILYTDSSPLSFITSSVTSSSKLCRWSSKLCQQCNS